MSTHEIEIEYGERFTDFIMSMYVETSLADDIDMLGWNLCGCDDAVFKEKIGNCRIISNVVGNGNVSILIKLAGNDNDMKEIIIEEIFDCWKDLVETLKKGLLSRN